MKKTKLIKKLNLFYKYHLKGNPAKYPERSEDELQVGDLNFDLDKFYIQLLKYKKYFKIKKVEGIVYKEQKLPIYEVDINYGRSKILILSGIHGNEQGGVSYVLSFLRDLVKNKKDYSGTRIKLLVPLNPAGCKYNSRFNAEGKDINRDFLKFETKEARLIAKTIRTFSPEYVVANHEAPQNGTFYFTSKWVSKVVSRNVKNSLASNGVVLADKNYFGLRLKEPGHIDLSGFYIITFKFWKLIFRKASFGLYCNENRLKEITIEGSWFGEDFDSRTAPHLCTIKALARSKDNW